MLHFGRALGDPHDLVVAPDLGYVRTWQRMAPLVDHVDAEAARVLDQHPAAPVLVVGHSLGGLIWLEVLDRHPDWWPRVHALVLVASPVGGTRLGRYLDPTGLSVGRDLRVNRRALAERLAAAIPCLTIAGDLFLRRDGTVSVASTQFAHARSIVLPRISHAGLVRSETARRLVRAFFRAPHPPATDATAIVARLAALRGLEASDPRGCWWARAALLFPDGYSVRLLAGPIGAQQVFVADNLGRCLYAHTVYRSGVPALQRTLQDLRQELAAQLV
jgi:pimeloyl-ACP methyl ester carboxylesterase